MYILKKAGHRRSRIAEMLGRHKSTISCELRRNQGLRGDRPQQAHEGQLVRRNDKVRSRVDERVWRQVDGLLCEKWSPEQVVSRLEMEQGIRLSHEWIYQHIYANKRSGGDGAESGSS
jgi:IS30 family transposase